MTWAAVLEAAFPSMECFGLEVVRQTSMLGLLLVNLVGLGRLASIF